MKCDGSDRYVPQTQLTRLQDANCPVCGREFGTYSDARFWRYVAPHQVKGEKK